MSIGRRTTRAVSWQFAARISDRALRLLSAVILARFLEPEAFGLIATTMAVVGAIEMLAFVGVEQAIIQSGRAQDPRFLGEALRLTALRGVAVSVSVAAAAPAVAWFYRDGALMGVMLMVAASPVIAGFMNPWIASRRRELDFRVYSLTMVAGGVAQVGVSVGLAWMGVGAQSLAVGVVGNTVVTVALGWLMLPRRIELRHDSAARAELRGFTGKAAGTPLFMLLGTEAPGVVLGRIVGLEVLGVYTLARRICALPTEVALPIFGRVLAPAYAGLREDPARLRATWLLALTGIPLAVMPAVMAAVVVDDALPTIVFGTEYAGAPGLVSLLSLAGLLSALVACCSSLFWGMGVPQVDRKAMAIRALCAATLAMPGAMYGGAVGAAAAAAAAEAATFVWSVARARVEVGASRTDILRALLPSALCGGASLAILACVDLFVRRIDVDGLLRIAALAVVALVATAAAAVWFLRKARSKS